MSSREPKWLHRLGWWILVFTSSAPLMRLLSINILGVWAEPSLICGRRERGTCSEVRGKQIHLINHDSWLWSAACTSQIAFLYQTFSLAFLPPSCFYLNFLLLPILQLAATARSSSTKTLSLMQEINLSNKLKWIVVPYWWRLCWHLLYICVKPN